MKFRLFTIVFLIYQLGFTQKTVYFPGFEMINMDSVESLQYSTSKLIKSYIENNHDYTILLDQHIGMRGYDARKSVVESAQMANELGVRYFMQGEIHFLQGVYIISLGVYEAEDNKQVWHDMAKGSVEQDLDALLSRLGRSFFTTRSAKTDIEIDEVTVYDQQGVELTQIKVNHFVGVMLGGKHIPNQSTLSGFGLAYTYDATTVLFDFDFELFPSSTLFIDRSYPDRKMNSGGITLGVTYPLTRKRSTAFLNGGMEYGYTSIRDASSDWGDRTTESGIGIYFGGGVLINRNSTVNLRIFTNVSLPFYKVEDANVSGVKFGIITSFARKK